MLDDAMHLFENDVVRDGENGYRHCNGDVDGDEKLPGATPPTPPS